MTQTQRNSETVTANIAAATHSPSRPQTDMTGVIALAHPSSDNEGATVPTRPQMPRPINRVPTRETGGVALSPSPEGDDELEGPEAGEQNAAASLPLSQKNGAIPAAPAKVGDEQQSTLTVARTLKTDTATAAAGGQSVQQGTSPLPLSTAQAGPGRTSAQGSAHWLRDSLKPIFTTLQARGQQLTERLSHWRDTRQGPEQARDWLESLEWYRLRYHSAVLTRQGLQVLAGSAGCGRVALVYTLYPFLHLYLGLPAAEGVWARQVATDYQFSLYPAPTPDALLTLRLQPADGLDWQRPFLAHLVGEQLFVMYQDAAAANTGQFWPEPSARPSGRNWQLPENPSFGLTTIRQLPPVPIPEAMQVTGKPDGSQWLLGRTPEGRLIQSATAQVNVYGTPPTLTDWLEKAVMARLTIQPARLVILDGQGDLTQRLRRHTLVADLLNRKQMVLANIHEASDSRTGFNPLAVVPGETERQTVQRWQTWFVDMGCSRQATALLLEAFAAGVRDLPQLRHWLEQPARLGYQNNDLLALKATLTRLLAAGAVREWLEWPTNLFSAVMEKAILFTCPTQEWAQAQLVKAFFQGVQAQEQVHLLTHGTGEGLITPQQPTYHPQGQLLSANGHYRPDATILLTALPEKQTLTLLQEVMPTPGAERLAETVRLLGPEEAVLLTPHGPIILHFH